MFWKYLAHSCYGWQSNIFVLNPLVLKNHRYFQVNWVINKLRISNSFTDLGEVCTKMWINLRKYLESEEFSDNPIDSIANWGFRSTSCWLTIVDEISIIRPSLMQLYMNSRCTNRADKLTCPSITFKWRIQRPRLPRFLWGTRTF